MHVFLALGLASLLAPLNSTMVAVALPAIRTRFDVGVVAVTWLVTGYLVAVAVSQPVGGRLGDAFGHLRLLRAGLALMAVFSLLSAVSPTFEVLVVTLSLQGIAAALLIPNATAYLRRSVPVERLGGSLGLVGVFTACGAAAGPVVGGLLLAVGDWRLLFYANLPVAVLAMALILMLPVDAGAGLGRARLQWRSILALVTAFSGLALLGTAARSEHGGLIALALGLAALGGAGYWLLYRRERSGVVDLHLFTSRGFANSAALTSLSNLVMYTTLIAIPVYLRDHRDSSSAAIGGVLFAMSATMAAVSWFGGRLGDSVGARTVLVTGGALMLGGVACTAVSFEAGSIALLVISLGVMGIGVGLSTPAQQTVGMSAWPANVAGSAAGTLSLMRYVGSVAGASMFAAVLGSSPGLRDLELLIAAVAVFGLANLAVALFSARPSRLELTTVTA